MLKATDIHKTYDGANKELQVLKGVNLEIEKGSFLSIIGPSGAGKSTLLHILGGLDAPTQGEVVFDGQDMYGLDDESLSIIRNKRIGFVFQFYHLLSEFTVLENVLMPVLIKTGAGGRGQGVKQKAHHFLENVGLKDRLSHFPGELSGGEKQRVAIVRALMNEPDLLLCDEPTGNLDSKSGEGIFGLIKKINKENNTTIVLVTHNAEFAGMADKVYYLKDGVLVN